MPVAPYLGRVRMTDAGGVEDEREGIGEVGWMEGRRRKPLGRVGSGLEKGLVGHHSRQRTRKSSETPFNPWMIASKGDSAGYR